MKELILIQNELKAPKSQFNGFGQYKYRNLEDIVEALKPILKKYNCYLTISDEIQMIGDRYYIQAFATLSNSEGKDITVSAFARETLTKKGMDEAQITGAASSYARKYALNGLFCIDDTKDSDSMNNTNDSKQKKEVKKDEDNNKPWFNEPEFEKLKKIKDNYTAEEAYKLALNKYKVSGKMKEKIFNLYK